MRTTIKTTDYTITFEDTPEVREQCFRMLLRFFRKHEAYDGEGICQSDTPQIEAPYLLSEIAEKAFRFKYESQ